MSAMLNQLHIRNCVDNHLIYTVHVYVFFVLALKMALHALEKFHFFAMKTVLRSAFQGATNLVTTPHSNSIVC